MHRSVYVCAYVCVYVCVCVCVCVYVCVCMYAYKISELEYDLLLSADINSNERGVSHTQWFFFRYWPLPSSVYLDRFLRKV